MNTTDIDPTAPPAEKRCTSHVFTTKPPSRALLYPGSTLLLSGTFQDPPAILFDAIYATTILHHFGTQSLRDLITVVWKDTTYPDGVSTSTQADHKKIIAERSTAVEHKLKQGKERDGRHERRRDGDHEGCNQPDLYDMLMILPYCLIPPNELQAMSREAKEKAEAAEQRRVQEKIDAWRQSTAI
jgi:hypothetical protein